MFMKFEGMILKKSIGGTLGPKERELRHATFETLQSKSFSVYKSLVHSATMITTAADAYAFCSLALQRAVLPQVRHVDTSHGALYSHHGSFLSSQAFVRSRTMLVLADGVPIFINPPLQYPLWRDLESPPGSGLQLQPDVHN